VGLPDRQRRMKIEDHVAPEVSEVSFESFIGLNTLTGLSTSTTFLIRVTCFFELIAVGLKSLAESH